jgi:DNA-binding NtrC family response regulator
MTSSRVLLVDENDEISTVFQEGLEKYGFEVVTASSVRRALSLITSEQFDVLLYDLHKPDASDVFVVVNALLHVHPNTVLLVLSRYPALQGGLSALLLKPDEILLKPIRIVVKTKDNAERKVINRSNREPRLRPKRITGQSAEKSPFSFPQSRIWNYDPFRANL